MRSLTTDFARRGRRTSPCSPCLRQRVVVAHGGSGALSRWRPKGACACQRPMRRTGRLCRARSGIGVAMPAAL